MNPYDKRNWHSTTVVAVRQGSTTALGADGQVTLGNTVMKGNAAKIRPLLDGKVFVGFAGSTADALSLMAKFESRLEEFRGNLRRAAVELAKDWRLDKQLRQLEALMVVTNGPDLLLISGTGDLFEPDDDIIAVGSGGPMALAAARALKTHTQQSPRDIVENSLTIAGEICIYTNTNLTIEVLEGEGTA